MSLVFLKEGNVKKSKRLMKKVNIEEENPISSQRIEKFQLFFEERCNS